MKIAPRNIEILYIVSIYKDMEFADEIETSNSFYSYQNALDFYNETIEKVKNNQYVSLEIEIEQEHENGNIYQVENINIANNFMEVNKTNG